MKSLFIKIAAMVIVCLSANGVVFAALPINTLSGGLFDRQTGIAIRGYDPVAYYLDNKPVKGSEEFSMEWNSAKWLFASKNNLERFKADPEKYAPQYGGYCAYGVAVDNLVSIEPDKFTIINGKLYLNYDSEVQTTWRKSPEKYISEADKKFTRLLTK
jgi:YHS domain-containing protein